MISLHSCKEDHYTIRSIQSANIQMFQCSCSCMPLMAVWTMETRAHAHTRAHKWKRIIIFHRFGLLVLLQVSKSIRRICASYAVQVEYRFVSDLKYICERGRGCVRVCERLFAVHIESTCSILIPRTKKRMDTNNE